MNLILLSIVLGFTQDGRDLLDQAGVRGGLCVHAGCDRALTTAIEETGRFLVHSPGNDAASLPYADKIVNLLVADLDALGPKAPATGEIDRVLVPGGVAMLRRGGQWERRARPWGDRADEWTHQWHGADGNLVSRDPVGPPNVIQWLGGPSLPVGDRRSSVATAVSAGGRIFYVERDPSSGEPARMKTILTARDAFNGLPLWRIPWRGTATPAAWMVNHAPLVASRDALFAGWDDGVAEIDPSTGAVRRTHRVGAAPRNLFRAGRILLVETEEGVRALDPEQGRPLWNHPATGIIGLLADATKVYFVRNQRNDARKWIYQARCLAADTGRELWRKDFESQSLFPYSVNAGFCGPGFLAIVDPEGLSVLSSEDGRTLWTRTRKMGESDTDTGIRIYQAVDPRAGGQFYDGGLVWLRAARERWQGFDALTGELRKELASVGAWPKSPYPGKIGCQPAIASEKWIWMPRQSTCIDRATGEKRPFDFVRGGCGVGGMIAANELVYFTPQSCSCFAQAVRGFVALGSGTSTATEADRFVKGPAFGAAPGTGGDDPWPTYRSGIRRAGAVAGSFPAQLRVLWEARPCGSRPPRITDDFPMVLSAPVVADGKVLASLPDENRVVAFDALSGRPAWSRAADGRVRTPPTVQGGLCWTAGQDGWAACLRVSDGAEVWRFRAAPAERRIVACGRLESTWPVAGGVTHHQGLIYVAAGRSSKADGGLQVHVLEPATGRVVASHAFTENLEGQGDVFIGDGRDLYLGGRKVDPKTGALEPAGKDADVLQPGQLGLLDSSWTRQLNGLRMPAIRDRRYRGILGQALAFRSGAVFAYAYSGDGGALSAHGDSTWSVKVPASGQVEALIAAGSNVYAAGPKDRTNRSAGGFLWCLDGATGARLSTLDLPAAPVADGLAAGYGRIILCSEDGTIRCLGPTSR
jgi:outer membrane protein assembly factor BamB